MTRADFEAGGGWQGFDVVRLYTNIDDQSDLKRALSEVFYVAWNAHVDNCEVVQVYLDNHIPPKWWPDAGAVHAHYGVWAAQRRSGMKNHRLGIDAARGQFYLFDRNHAQTITALLIDNTYVRFGPHYYKQQRGIPMGINPAVYMANYYLFWYEYRFICQLRDILCDYPPVPGYHHVARDMLLTWTDEDLSAPEVGLAFGNCAQQVLNAFRFVFRFVDDLSSGPNPFLRKLLYNNHYLLTDNQRIFGIYPAQYLTLEATPGENLYSFTTLDLHIVTHCDNRVRDSDVFVHSLVCLYDKRRLPCYRGIPIVQFNHVSSNVSLHAGYNVALSQLHRYAHLITDRDNYVLECARLLKHFNLQGYNVSLLYRKLRRHLMSHCSRYGDTSWRPLWHAIRACLARINVLHYHHQTAWRFGLQLLSIPTDGGEAGTATEGDDDDDAQELEFESFTSDIGQSSDDMDISS
jgi:hypothetical protein